MCLQDDLGSPLVCNGFITGIMTSHIVDRPAGIGFLDLRKFFKYLTCGVDDARDVINNDHMSYIVTETPIPMPTFQTVENNVTEADLFI